MISRRPRLPKLLSRLLALLLLPGLLAPTGLAFDACDCDGLCRVACACEPRPAVACGSCDDAAPARASAALTEEGCGCCVGDATPASAPIARLPAPRDAGPIVAIAPVALVTVFLPRVARPATLRTFERHVVSPLAARLRPLLC